MEGTLKTVYLTWRLGNLQIENVMMIMDASFVNGNSTGLVSPSILGAERNHCCFPWWLLSLYSPSPSKVVCHWPFCLLQTIGNGMDLLVTCTSGSGSCRGRCGGRHSRGYNSVCCSSCAGNDRPHYRHATHMKAPTQPWCRCVVRSCCARTPMCI